MSTKHRDRELGWAGILFGLLDFNNSRVHISTYSGETIINYSEGDLEHVGGEETAAGDDEVSLVLFTDGGDYASKTTISSATFQRGAWEGGALVVYTTTGLTYWISP